MSSDPNDRVWEMMEKIGIAMLVTTVGSEAHARPMGASVKREHDAVYFLTNADSGKANDIAANPNVTLLFADPSGQKYVALKGRADVIKNAALVKELWTVFAKAWWDGPEDPEIRVVRVKPESAEFWDSPGKIASYAAMLSAAVTGAKPKVGDNKTVAL